MRRLEMKKSALLIIDVQNDYFPKGAHELVDANLVLDRIVEIEQTAIESNMVIYYIQHINHHETAKFFHAGTNGADLHPALAYKDAVMVVKGRPNSFFETSLLVSLKADNITDLVITGMMTNMCVDATVRAAHELGFNVTLLAGACTTKDQVWNGKIIEASVASAVIYSSLSMLVTVEDYAKWLKGNRS